MCRGGEGREISRVSDADVPRDEVRQEIPTRCLVIVYLDYLSSLSIISSNRHFTRAWTAGIEATRWSRPGIHTDRRHEP